MTADDAASQLHRFETAKVQVASQWCNAGMVTSVAGGRRSDFYIYTATPTLSWWRIVSGGYQIETEAPACVRDRDAHVFAGRLRSDVVETHFL